mmetsp:Transcript_11851/g.28121  ORF Transcript_11851/g.28121 Transcript_11851/m.28121 type:complete len:235 (-) Transcript_11851:4841-5545(-)
MRRRTSARPAAPRGGPRRCPRRRAPSRRRARRPAPRPPPPPRGAACQTSPCGPSRASGGASPSLRPPCPRLASGRSARQPSAFREQRASHQTRRRSCRPPPRGPRHPSQGRETKDLLPRPCAPPPQARAPYAPQSIAATAGPRRRAASRGGPRTPLPDRTRPRTAATRGGPAAARCCSRWSPWSTAPPPRNGPSARRRPEAARRPPPEPGRLAGRCGAGMRRGASGRARRRRSR